MSSLPAMLLCRTVGSTASGDVFLPSPLGYFRADGNDLSSAGISSREGKYTQSENHWSEKP